MKRNELLIHTLCSRAQSCEALWDPMDCSPPWSSVHGIFQARLLKWVAFYFSRWSSRPRNWTWISCISCIGRRILYHYTTWKAQYTKQLEWIPRGLPSGKSWPQSFHSVWFHYITFHLKLIKLQKWRTESRRRWGGEETAKKQASWWWCSVSLYCCDFLPEFLKMLPLEEASWDLSTVSYNGLWIFHLKKKSI